MQPEDKVFTQCFHHRDTCEIIEEAENVIVLFEKPQRKYQNPEGTLHVWVYTSTGWSSCKMLSPSVWNDMPMAQKMTDLQDTLKFLKTMTP